MYESNHFWCVLRMKLYRRIIEFYSGFFWGFFTYKTSYEIRYDREEKKMVFLHFWIDLILVFFPRFWTSDQIQWLFLALWKGACSLMLLIMNQVRFGFWISLNSNSVVSQGQSHKLVAKIKRSSRLVKKTTIFSLISICSLLGRSLASFPPHLTAST